jgi:hypothetical protein
MMQSTHSRALGLFAAALAVAALGGCSAEGVAADAGVLPPSPDSGATTSAFQVRVSMRDGWLDEAQWSQLYVMAAAGQRPDLSQTVARLTQAENAIAAQMAPFVGKTNAGDLGALLLARAQDLQTYVGARLRNDARGASEAQTIWYSSCDDIARLVASFGRSWSMSDLQSELRQNVSAMIYEVSASLSNDRNAEVSSSAGAEKHALGAADVIASGLAGQFAATLGPSGMTSAAEAANLQLRPLFQDQAYWVRVTVIQRMAGENQQPALDRALDVNKDITAVFTGAYPASLGPQFSLGLHDMVMGAYAYLIAGELGGQDAKSATLSTWLQNADSFASFLARTSTSWAFSDLDTVLHENANRTSAEIDARLAADWANDVVVYDRVVANDRNLSGSIASGIANVSLPTLR